MSYKKKLSKKELDELKKGMRLWERAKIDNVKHLYAHIEALEAEIKTLSADLNKFKQESIFETHGAKVEAQAKWPTPSCSYEPDEVPQDQRGTVLNRLIDLKRKGLVGSEPWNLNLRYSRLTHKQALDMLEASGN